MTQLLLLSGSQRQDSFNTRLLHHVAQHVDDTCHIVDAAPLAGRLPLFNQDLEDDPAIRAQVAALHQAILASDGLWVASPEYNGLITPYLKNMVDWVSRLAYIDPRFDNPFVDKPVLLMSASTGGSGAAMAIPSARALFGYVGAVVFGETVSIPFAQHAWTDLGYLFDEAMEHRLHHLCTRFIEQAHHFQRHRPR